MTSLKREYNSKIREFYKAFRYMDSDASNCDKLRAYPAYQILINELVVLQGKLNLKSGNREMLLGFNIEEE